MFTNLGLVEHVKKALVEKWGYVYGTIGQILTEAILQYKMKQYPNNVPQYETFIRENWMGRRTADCVNLIKSYIWWNNGNVKYNPDIDVSADGMYKAAKKKGDITTIPDIPGLCVWKDGHIGVYIGNGQVIEAHGTKSGVIKTPLKGAGSTPWTHWLECPFISYEGAVDSGNLYKGCTGDKVKELQTKLNKIGYGLTVDGDFGPKTEIAVASFQGHNSLTPTGVVDENTMKVIDDMITRLEGPKKKTWIEIVESVSANPAEWQNAINVAVKAAEAEGDLGALEMFKYLPLLIEKIGNNTVK